MMTIHRAMAENKKNLTAPYTIVELSKVSGVSRPTIHKIQHIPVNECRDQKLKTLQKLYAALGLEFEIVIRGAE